MIPAYNAAATIDETLLSARRQTHGRIEIIVVNDGSTDATLQIAHAHARADSRVRILDTPRAGVATARNRGIAETRAELIAPLDADDLWHPSKIELQIEVIKRGGRGVGFVYAGFRRIDMCGRILQTAALQCVDGSGFLQAIFSNFVGNGSSLLLRRSAFEETGGYEPGLRKLGVEGAEDHLLQIAIARRWHVACIPYCLVGYRQTTTAMSRDHIRIMRSQLAVLDFVAELYEDVPGWVLRAARADLEARLAIAYAVRGKIGPFFHATGRSLLNQPLCGLDTLCAVAHLGLRKAGQKAAAVFGGASAAGPGPMFNELDFGVGLKFRGARPNGWMISRLRSADANFPTQDHAAAACRSGELSGA